MSTSSLIREVVGLVEALVRSRDVDLVAFTRSQYSFEEWLNWELFAASSRRYGSTVFPKPNYRQIGVDTCDAGDLLIEHGGSRLFVEVGIVHDGTRDRWLDKLEHDRLKLLRIPGFAVPLQLLLSVSQRALRTDRQRSDWLERLSFWNAGVVADMFIELPGGWAQLRAWSHAQRTSSGPDLSAACTDDGGTD